MRSALQHRTRAEDMWAGASPWSQPGSRQARLRSDSSDSALMTDTLSRRMAILLFALVIFSWGITWPVTKAIVASSPALERRDPLRHRRHCIARAAAAARRLDRAQARRLAGRRQHRAPAHGGFRRAGGRRPAVHHAGRSVVLGYTAPLWVVPGARLFLGERITARRAAGVGIGVAGLALMFNPLAFDWSDERHLRQCA